MHALKSFFRSSLLFLSFWMTFTVPVQAATGILPGGGEISASEMSSEECFALVEEWTVAYAESGYYGMPEDEAVGESSVSSDLMLACALKSGNMQFWMVPYFVNYALEFIITVAGVLVVLMIIVGGYFYIWGAVTDDKEKGKTIITYAIGGYILVLISWFIVNALLLLVTQ